jgi:hypothetical protein|tara:strand:- start:283 stop:717 length:435 start_codon:yes stop_codon:yes gene_type:complete
MLAEVQAANAAFNTIKSALKNGRELYDVSDSCATYFNSKSVISRRANKKRKGSYLENFMHLEKLKKQEEWIREWMIYAGRPGLYDDWLKFQSECKRMRAAEERRRRDEANSIEVLAEKWLKWMGAGITSVGSILVTVMEVLNTA